MRCFENIFNLFIWPVRSVTFNTVLILLRTNMNNQHAMASTKQSNYHFFGTFLLLLFTFHRQKRYLCCETNRNPKSIVTQGVPLFQYPRDIIDKASVYQMCPQSIDKIKPSDDSLNRRKMRMPKMKSDFRCQGVFFHAHTQPHTTSFQIQIQLFSICMKYHFILVARVISNGSQSKRTIIFHSNRANDSGRARIAFTSAIKGISKIVFYG